jgi:hypothetical protein
MPDTTPADPGQADAVPSETAADGGPVTVTDSGRLMAQIGQLPGAGRREGQAGQGP